MTNEETLKLALEALKDCRRDPRLKYEHKFHDKVIKALEEALAKQEQGEPVAWMHPDWPDGYSGFQSPVTTYMTNGWIPLYTTPQPKQEQGEPVAYDVRCDNCGGDGYDPKNNNYYCSVCEGSRFVEKMLYTTPQQRKPLTHEQVYKMWLARFETNEYDDVFMNFARAIEAAHGIKE